MRATVMYGAGDVRVENVPDSQIKEPTDAIVRVTRACICGSDLWPYHLRRPRTGFSAWATRQSGLSKRSAPRSGP
jgi:threonine dehydrogenase-like Zn-dependent dehydrogenase